MCLKPFCRVHSNVRPARLGSIFFIFFDQKFKIFVQSKIEFVFFYELCLIKLFLWAVFLIMQDSTKSILACKKKNGKWILRPNRIEKIFVQFFGRFSVFSVSCFRQNQRQILTECEWNHISIMFFCFRRREK